MLNSEKNRFPYSSNLFLLCKEILNVMHARGEKVSNQDVGALLDFDPADSTHWKYGRKNIQSIHSLAKISDKLELDLHSLIEVVQGRASPNDTIFDFKGYGSFVCNDNIRTLLSTEATSLLKKAKIISAPVFIPDILEAVPAVEVRAVDAQKEMVEENYVDNKKIISYRGENLCGSLRFLIMQKVAKTYLETHANRLNFNQDITDAEGNFFALLLLTPTFLLQSAVYQRNATQDIVHHLSDAFWLTPFLINTRLKDFFQYKN